eukprot:NODE_1350_length_989_cov_18.257447_g940_i0.p1 GENE.NODE_1350_length_989_cov_18.257447_g940_i0~~NODE_1350_length_989_cov_18.257447_g940_i0.p1  ORF type:complete len:311 (-),score=96.56 NODE_1350_length_989_cov_18.257447_g940_i0:57-962(-)
MSGFGARLLARRTFASGVATSAPRTPVTRSVNWARHWKKAFGLSSTLWVIYDVANEKTFIGSILRAITESPTTWLSPAKISAAMDSAVFTMEKSYLADRPPQLRGRPTLCVNLMNILVSGVYDKEAKHWQILKRPGVDLFLERMSEKYELVIWSSHGIDNAVDMVTRLDPEHKFFHDTISKEAERPEAPEKDLTYLGRPTQRVIVLDYKENPQEQFHDNTILLPQYYGSKEEMAADRTLYNLIPFLEYLADQTSYYDLPRLIRAYKDYGEKISKPLPFAFLELQEKRATKERKWYHALLPK